VVRQHDPDSRHPRCAAPSRSLFRRAHDDFLDQWTASDFDPAAWARLFAETGASYVIPTTKHHDGVALWDAPGTGTRNTVHRGPRRDLVGEIADAVRQAGMRFGVYYSGGLDWGVTDFPPLTSHADFTACDRRIPRTTCTRASMYAIW
jgi:alpha-L-fucosidase